jgi:hypothetical protein
VAATQSASPHIGSLRSELFDAVEGLRNRSAAGIAAGAISIGDDLRHEDRLWNHHNLYVFQSLKGGF